MIFYYALGGGLGHVTRAQALIYTLGGKAPVTLAMSSAWDDVLPISDQFHQLKAPRSISRDPKGVREWLREQLTSRPYRIVIIDAFPGGLLGELCDFAFPAGVTLVHCARLLRWPIYSEMLKSDLPKYHQCYQLESINDDHMRALSAHCAKIDTLNMSDPPVVTSDRSMTPQMRPKPNAVLWLIVHAGSADEIIELVHFAQDTAALEGVTPHFMLLSPRRPDALSPVIDHHRVYPAHAWFAKADRIFTACGFNTVRQLRPHRAKHRFMPFLRRFDDQFARAAMLRANTWDLFKSSDEASPLNLKV